MFVTVGIDQMSTVGLRLGEQFGLAGLGRPQFGRVGIDQMSTVGLRLRLVFVAEVVYSAGGN
jgi:hypothetical protein